VVLPKKLNPNIAADHLASIFEGRSSLMEVVNGATAEEGRKPLSEMVDDCVQRWFQDTLKEARRGDSAMQVLVAQMYNSGYGIPRNEHKVLPCGPLPLLSPSPFSTLTAADVFHA
jgi:hypothetical protein